MSTRTAAAVDYTTQSFVRGEVGALRDAYESHGELVFTFAARALGPERAFDVTQEVFLSAWRARSRFDPSTHTLRSWLVGIAKNRIIDRVRAERRHTERSSRRPRPGVKAALRRAGASSGQLPAPATVTETDIDTIGDGLLIHEALADLPQRAREIVKLAFFEDLTHPQIAERTNLPLGTIKSDLRRSLAQLSRELEPLDRRRGERTPTARAQIATDLATVVTAFAPSAIEGALGVSASDVASWIDGQTAPKFQESAALSRIAELVRATGNEMMPGAAHMWMTSSNFHLGGRAPIDIAAQRDTSPALEALALYRSGAYC